MIYTPMTIKAMQIAYEAHQGQFDQSGVPYIFHPYHVAEQMEDELTTCIALLHDVIEDTDVTEEQLSKDFSEEVMEALRLLTHTSDIPYMDYIRKIKEHPIAKIVKRADIDHNMDMSRVKGTEVSGERIQYWEEKYRKALSILEE